jgi:REP element-mobilizing transposase RayT
MFVAAGRPNANGMRLSNRYFAHCRREEHRQYLVVPRTPKQLSFMDYRKRSGRGGPRPGAGRPRGPRPRVWHRSRGKLAVRCPVHVTLRVRPDVPSLRTVSVVREFRRSLAEASERGNFRVPHYSMQGDHLHLIVEADDVRALANGMKSIGARLARAVNRVLGRSGPVLDGRYHHRVLRTPREVRRALAYVLLNARRHLRKRRGPAGARRVLLDPASSARWFDGWRREAASRLPTTDALPEVARARTWLLRVGWRRHGLVDPGETPGGALPVRA